MANDTTSIIWHFLCNIVLRRAIISQMSSPQGDDETTAMRQKRANYKCEATTLDGFIQQLAVAYIARRYFFYVTGDVPKRLTSEEHDRRLLEKFEVAQSKWSRYRRRKRNGSDGRPLANVQYIRYRSFWVLLATGGSHRFFEEHGTPEDNPTGNAQFRDVRQAPICYGGYSIGWRERTSVRLSATAYRDLKSYFLRLATSSPGTKLLEQEFWRFPFEPYGGVIRQVLSIHRTVNRARKTAGLREVPRECLRLKRRVVRPFEPVDVAALPLAA